MHLKPCPSTVIYMRQGTYTLPENELVAISRLEPLTPDQGAVVHNFRSSNFDEAEEDGVDISSLTLPWQSIYRNHTPDYILYFKDGTPLAWFTRKEERNSWYIPRLRNGLPSSLYRITTFIEGLRLGMLAAEEVA